MVVEVLLMKQQVKTKLKNTVVFFASKFTMPIRTGKGRGYKAMFMTHAWVQRYKTGTITS